MFLPKTGLFLNAFSKDIDGTRRMLGKFYQGSAQRRGQCARKSVKVF